MIDIKQILKFGLVGGIGVIINSAILYTLTDLASIHYLISNLFAIAGASAWNYIMYKTWVFKK